MIFLGVCLMLMIGCTKEDIQPDKPKPTGKNTVYIPVPASLNPSKTLGLKSSFENDSVIIDTLLLNDLPENFYDKLLLYFPFDDSTVNDVSLRGNDGLIETTPGSSGVFNGSNQSTYIKIPFDTTLNFKNKPFSICAWFYPISRNDGRTQAIIGKARDNAETLSALIVAEWNDSENVYIGFDMIDNSGQYHPSTLYTTSIDFLYKWHFTVASFDGDNVYLYIDGVLKSNSNCPGFSLASIENPLYVGREICDGVRYFYGAMDNIMIFNYAISDKEVQTLYDLRVK